MAEPGSEAWALRGSLSGVHVPSLTERMSSLKETTAGRASSSVVKEKPPPVLPAVSETPKPAEAAAPDPAAVAAPSPPAAVPEPAPPPAAVPEPAPAVGPEARCVVLEKENAELRAKNEALLAQVGKQAQALAVLRMENEALHGAVTSMRDDSRRISVGDEDDSPGGRNRRISVEEAAGVLALEEARASARRKEEEQAAIKVQAIARGKLTRDEIVQRESATKMGAEAMLRIFSEQFASHNNIDD